MKKLACIMTVFSLFSFLIVASTLADSSGNFTATGTSASCTATPATFNSNTGDFEGDTLSGGTGLTSFTTSIQTPSGKGTTLLIRPSLATGLFTATKLSTTINNATADVGIQVCVWVDPDVTTVGGVTTYSGGLNVDPANCIVYDQRIQQVSNTLFATLADCLPTVTTTTCTVDADCSALGTGATCVNGFCNLPPTATNCNFEILLTTLSAHSFDYVVKGMKNGDHDVVMTWEMIGTDKNTAGGSTLACVGPVSLTVQQVKNFSNSQKIDFLSD